MIDFDDYTRVREFNIDEKGTVVSRGDSFRLKSPPNRKRGKFEHFKHEIHIFFILLYDFSKTKKLSLNKLSKFDNIIIQ